MINDATLARFARRLRIGVAAAAILLVLATLVAALWPALGLAGLDTRALPYGWGVALAFVDIALIVLALAELARMLRRVERGELFSPAATRHFRGFARLLLIAAVARIVLPPVAGLAAAAANGGHGAARLSLDDNDALLLILGALLFLIARLFDEGARLAEDSRSIV